MHMHYNDSNNPNSPNNDGDTDTDDDSLTSSSSSNDSDERSTGILEPSSLETDFNEAVAGIRKNNNYKVNEKRRHKLLGFKCRRIIL